MESTLSSIQLEEKYQNYLSDKIKRKYPKSELLERLGKINWSVSQGRKGKLCCRLGTCSPDCVGNDC